jgi:hypothetical protein
MDQTQSDPVVAAVLEEALADPDALGLLLAGSRGAGHADAHSDYDFVRVLTDLAFQVRAEHGQPSNTARSVQGQKVEISDVCPAILRQLAERPSWHSPDYATAVVLFDRTGELARLAEAIASLPAERAARDAAAWYDAYLNGYYRSTKAARRGNELGARLQAAESAVYLVKTLFALIGRVAPHHDRLVHQVHAVEHLAWAPGALAPRLLAIVRTADPMLQRELEREVAALMRQRGHGGVRDAWGGELDRVQARPG